MNTDPLVRANGNQERREELIEGLVERIERLGLARPALLFLEAHKPLSFLGSQALLFFEPALGFLVGDHLLQSYALLLEDPENVERIAQDLVESIEQGRS